MQFSGAQAAEFIDVLRPALDVNNLTHIQINCCDTMGYGVMDGFLNQMRNVESSMGVATGHSYTSSPTSPLATQLKTWQTEAADNEGAWTSSWFQGGGPGEGMTLASNIHTAITAGNVSAYLYWIGAQDRPSNTNSKMIRVVNGAVEPSKRLWAMANWSRFVRPGAVRVGTEGSGVRTSAFVNVDGALAVQVINGGNEQAVVVSVTGGEEYAGATTATAWVTDNERDCDEIPASVANDGTVSSSIPSRSMVTFLIFPPSAAA